MLMSAATEYEIEGFGAVVGPLDVIGELLLFQGVESQLSVGGIVFDQKNRVAVRSAHAPPPRRLPSPVEPAGARE